MPPAAVRVRMYRVGMGDCFLITFPGPRYLLVDCGTLGAGLDLAPVVADIAHATGGHLHVVIASHRHGDHVSGFATEAARFNQIRVDEVWLPWTEDPEDAAALAMRQQLDAVARHLARTATDPRARSLARNSITDSVAMDVLLRGFHGCPRRRFLSSLDGDMGSDALPGVNVMVVGPPRTEAFLQRADLDCAMATLTLEAAELRAAAPRAGPFADRWQLDRAVARRLFAAELRRDGLIGPGGADDGSELCFRLDKAINNTSLLLSLRCGRARLLLAGDSTSEAWMPLLDSEHLLAEMSQMSLYKVSHHGSHNGTPPRILAALGRRGGGPRLTCLVSAEPGLWSAIPRQPLLRRLAGTARVVRSDQPQGRRRSPWVEVTIEC